MRSGKKANQKNLSLSCESLHEDDQVDPRIFFRKEVGRRTDRKTQQLCRQVRDILSSLWCEQSEDFFGGWLIDAVEPAPHASRLRVLVHSQEPQSIEAIESLRTRLQQLRVAWREILAQAIHRKHAPDIFFELLQFHQTPPTQEDVLKDEEDVLKDEETAPQDEEDESALLRMWLAEPLPKEVKAALQRLQETDDARFIAVMPDVHLAEDVCIGVVLATRRLLYPQAVGGDIGCGMLSVRFDVDASALSDEQEAARLFALLAAHIPAQRHPTKQELPSSLQELSLSQPFLETIKSRDGQVQFGTLGAGNHFLEFQADEQQRLWLTIHSGSRAVGQAIYHHHLRQASISRTKLLFLDSEEPEGMAYLQDAAWAVSYAEANRRRMMEILCEQLRKSLGWEALEDTVVTCDHNHVRREFHDGQMLWIHRKGANAAHLGVPAIIPGSMGTASYLVDGRGLETSLASSSHGAGRQMSRSQARKLIRPQSFFRQMEGVWFDHRRSTELLDEAPSAYKDIHAVMRAQRELVRILHTLRPLLSYKG